MNSKLPANVAVAANPAAVYLDLVPGGAALIIYGFAQMQLEQHNSQLEHTSCIWKREIIKTCAWFSSIKKKNLYSEIGVGEERVAA